MSLLLEWIGPLNGLLIGFNLIQSVRHWRRKALPFSCRVASSLISCLALASLDSNDGPSSLLGSTCMALALAVGAPLLGRRAPRSVAMVLKRTRLTWPVTLAGHAIAGATVVIAHLWLSPSPLTGQLVGYGLYWGLVDKRWVVASYILGVSLVVVLPIFLRRSFELLSLQPAPPTDQLAEPPENRGFPRIALKSLACLVFSAALATWFFAESFTTMAPTLDLHELVHLGSLQGIQQGLLPYLEAETQYGPGHQLLTYHMMERTDFSMHGFRLSHLLTNLLAVTLVYFCYLKIFRGWIAFFLIAVSLWISPVLYFELYGWTVIPRWLGPVLTGLLLPSLILHQRSWVARRLASFLLGALGGLLAWIASENLFGSVITFTLASVLFWSIRAVTTRALVEISLSWFLGLFSTLTLSFLSIFELGQIGQVAGLYFRTSSMVSNGLSNGGWGTTWNTWAWPYFLTPYLLIAASLATLYLPEALGVDPKRQLARIRLIGLLAAAIVLQIVTLLRTDTIHLIGPSLALGAVVVLSIFHIPELAARREQTRRRIRTGIVVGVLLIYPIGDLVASLARRLPFDPADARAVALYLADVVTPVGPSIRPTDAARRLGWEVASDDTSDHQTGLTYGEWLQLMDQINHYVDGRKTVVSRFDDVFPSAIYFFSNLRVVLAVEPMMSVWTHTDVERWRANLAAREVDCLISTHLDDPIRDTVLASFQRYSTHRVEEPIAFAIHCLE